MGKKALRKLAMIVLVEDDTAIGRSVTQGLQARGYDVHWLRQGKDFLTVLSEGKVRVVILDVGLPDADGFELCRAMRAIGHRQPVLMLTARGGLDDKLDGFEAGADDYLAKPFAFAELVARVAVLARRAAQMPPEPVFFGKSCVELAERCLTVEGVPVALEPKPLALLLALAAARTALVPRDQLIAAVWGPEATISDNTLDATISALRRRLTEAGADIAVRAVKGQGYLASQRHLIP